MRKATKIILIVVAILIGIALLWGSLAYREAIKQGINFTAYSNINMLVKINLTEFNFTQ
jgi:hypothetical protein